MTREEAIKELKRIVADYKIEDAVRGGLLSWQKRRLDMIEIIIKDIQKQIPKNPIGDLDSVPHYRCPACFSGIVTYQDSLKFPYCHHCGQAIDWRDEE